MEAGCEVVVAGRDVPTTCPLLALSGHAWAAGALHMSA